MIVADGWQDGGRRKRRDPSSRFVGHNDERRVHRDG